MRVVLPGTRGSTNTYYVRVQRWQLEQLAGGQSEGLYSLQIRLQQQVQFPGSVVQFANLIYSTNGVSGARPAGPVAAVGRVGIQHRQ